MAAQTLCRSNSALGGFYRRMQSRMYERPAYKVVLSKSAENVRKRSSSNTSLLRVFDLRVSQTF